MSQLRDVFTETSTITHSTLVVMLLIALFYLIISFCESSNSLRASTGQKCLKFQKLSLFTADTLADSTSNVPTNGIIPYIGSTLPSVPTERRWLDNSDEDSDANMHFVEVEGFQKFLTKFNLLKQYPWKRIAGKVVLKTKIQGEIPLDSVVSSFSFSSTPDDEVSTLNDISRLFRFSAHDPRVTNIFLNIGRVTCGYAKLKEIRRSMSYFRQSGYVNQSCQ